MSGCHNIDRFHGSRCHCYIQQRSAAGLAEALADLSPSWHQPGEIGPMSLLTYEGVRPWAKAIKAAVLSKKMPPWFADPRYGHFANDRTLSKADVDALVAWADSGAPEGDPKDRPAPVKWTEGWNIPKP